MKTFISLVGVALLSVAGLVYADNGKIETKGNILVAGSYWDQIMLLDKETGKALWKYDIPGHVECNSACLTKEGDIFYSNRTSARLIDFKGKVLMEYPAKEGEEIQTAMELASGNFWLAICGHPARLVELTKKGEVVKEIKFETGIEEVHDQFRSVYVTDRDTCLVSLLASKKVIELDGSGKVLREVEIPFPSFGVKILKDGNWLISGDDGNVAIFDPEKKAVIRMMESNSIKGVTLLYAAESRMLDNGNLMITNWNGHTEDKSQPKLIEVDPDGKLVWSLKTPEKIENISTFVIGQ